MWTFLATEAMFFGALFLGLTAYRYAYAEAFEKASEKLNWVVGGINTLVLLVSSLMGSTIPDAVASLLIGVLLAVTAFRLARPVADLLVGRSLSPEGLAQLTSILASDPSIEEVLTVHAVYTGPLEVIVAAKVHPAAGLTVDQLTRAMDGLDGALRSALPEVADVYLDVTSYRLATLQHAT